MGKWAYFVVPFAAFGGAAIGEGLAHLVSGNPPFARSAFVIGYMFVVMAYVIWAHRNDA